MLTKQLKSKENSLIFQASFSDEFEPRQRELKQDTQFYKDGIWELGKLGFYIENEKTRTCFESLQIELEEVQSA